MDGTVQLLPAPRRVERQEGSLALAAGRLILLDGPDPQALRFEALRLKSAIKRATELDWSLAASRTTPADLVGATLRLDPGLSVPADGYVLSVSPSGILVEARDSAGVFYGVCTVVQILEQSAGALQCVRIEDWPDYPVRGVMLDVTRDKVPTLETLKGLVDLFASLKLNQLQLYTEHAFAYRNHPEVWASASPITGEDILDLDAYCAERHIELVPNQNCFGHLKRWLELPRYAPLAETQGDFNTPWGIEKGPFSLCPTDPGSLDLVRGILDELMPHFTSQQVNVGFDETFDVGQGRSAEEVARRGAARVYLDFLTSVYEHVRSRGKVMQYWGDIVVEQPELIPELPKDAIALEWGYEATHPFAEHAAKFGQAGVPFYLCPGTSGGLSLAGRTENTIGNIQSAALHGRANGATGLLVTDWGDRGHWHALPVSYLGCAVAAASSWALDANKELDVAVALSRHVFRDPTGIAGSVAYDLGNVYRYPGYTPPSSSVLFWILQMPVAEIAERSQSIGGLTIGGITAETLNRTLEEIDRAIAPLAGAKMDRPDAALVVRELELTAGLLRHASRRGMLLIGQSEDPSRAKRELAADLHRLVAEYESVWLARNRPGGLADSVARFGVPMADYEG